MSSIIDCIAARLKELHADSKMKWSEVMEVTGVSEATWRRYEKGESTIDAVAITKFCRKYGYSLDWLLIGQGSMYRHPGIVGINDKASDHMPEHFNTAESDLISASEKLIVFSPVGFADQNEESMFNWLADELINEIETIDDEIEVDQEPGDSPYGILPSTLKSGIKEKLAKLKELGAPRKQYGMKASGESQDFALIPRLNVEASAGHGSVVANEDVRYMMAFRRDWIRQELRVSPERLRIISARGDSMDSGKGLESDIQDGALLLIDSGVERIDGDAIYAIQYDGHLLVKRIQQLIDGSVKIISAHPAYEPQYVSPDAISDIRIAGRVVFVISGRRV